MMLEVTCSLFLVSLVVTYFPTLIDDWYTGRAALELVDGWLRRLEDDGTRLIEGGRKVEDGGRSVCDGTVLWR